MELHELLDPDLMRGEGFSSINTFEPTKKQLLCAEKANYPISALDPDSKMQIRISGRSGLAFKKCMETPLPKEAQEKKEGDKGDKTILGMKPLTFGLVAIVLIVGGSIAFKNVKM